MPIAQEKQELEQAQKAVEKLKVELKEEQSLLDKEAKTLKESLSVKFKSVTSSSSANETASEQSQPSVTDPIPASKQE